LLEKLPEIFRQKIQDGWRIFYQDEVGFQTEGTLAATWGIRGQATKVANYGRHGRMNVIGAFELGHGAVSWRVNELPGQRHAVRRFILSLKRRLGTEQNPFDLRQRVFPQGQGVYYLGRKGTAAGYVWNSCPAYSPDFNPFDVSGAGSKPNTRTIAVGRRRRRFRQHLRECLQAMPEQAEALQSLMKKENQRYREICTFYQTEFQPLFADG